MANYRTEFEQKIMESPEIPDNYKYYWGYMYGLGVETVVPYLVEKNLFKPGMNVAEIGSAEGGVLAAFVEKGAESALGTDIAIDRLEMGDKIAKIGGLDIEFTSHDIIFDEPQDKWRKLYDIVLLRDVIEHLDDTEIALTNIKKVIKKDGYLFVSFPPYFSPFGGHQHTIGHKSGMIPYLHLLPKWLFFKLISKGRERDLVEVERLTHIKLTPNKFLKAAKAAGYEVAFEDYYLLRPVFKMKFGLPTLRTTPIKWLPFVKSLFSLEACYVLKVNE